MGRAEIKFSLSSLASVLQLPEGFSITNVQMHPESDLVILIVEGATVEHGEEYQGMCQSVNNEDGRWGQVKWELAPTYYGTIEELKRTWNLPNVNSDATS